VKSQSYVSCHCGGVKGAHYLGQGNCSRVLLDDAHERYPIKSLEAGYYYVDGESEPITERSLKGQRGYCRHTTGHWSKPKDQDSTNSLK